MNNEPKAWTPNPGSLCLPSKHQQTLCEPNSPGFAVQSAPDCTTPNVGLLRSQPLSDDAGPFLLKCSQCECEFESDNGFDRICEPCNAENYDRERDTADFIFNNP